MRRNGQRRRLCGRLRGPSGPSRSHFPCICRRVCHGSGAARRRVVYSTGGGEGMVSGWGAYTHSKQDTSRNLYPPCTKKALTGPRGPAPGTKWVSKRGTGCSRTPPTKRQQAEDHVALTITL
jgi:hypothetical protein